jgi:hypothetical protein
VRRARLRRGKGEPVDQDEDGINVSLHVEPGFACLLEYKALDDRSAYSRGTIGVELLGQAAVALSLPEEFRQDLQRRVQAATQDAHHAVVVQTSPHTWTALIWPQWEDRVAGAAMVLECLS